MTDGMPWWAAAGAGALALGCAARAAIHPRSQWFGKVLWHGPRDQSSVALTFDDGPHPDGTPAILDRLGEEKVQATFFVIGAHVQRWPDLARRIVDEGHQLANHSHDHSHLGLFHLKRYWRDQIRKTNDLIESMAGQGSPWFRPPMGMKHHSMMAAVRAEQMQAVTWSHRGCDGVRTTADKICKRLASATAGDILLLHDGVDPHRSRSTAATVAAVRPLVQGLKSRGLRCERLDAFFE